MRWLSFEATASVAYKEFLHIYRDRRVLLLVLLLPPLFTLLLGHAFETSEMTDVPSMLINRDNTPRSQEFIDIISKNKTFQWRYGSPQIQNESDLLAYHVRATLVVPRGWNESLENGDPKPLLLYLDGSDINTGDAVEGSVRQSLGDFQLKERDRMIAEFTASNTCDECYVSIRSYLDKSFPQLLWENVSGFLSIKGALS